MGGEGLESCRRRGGEGGHLEPLSVGQRWPHPRCKEDGRYSQHWPGQDHEDAVGLEQLAAELAGRDLRRPDAGRIEVDALSTDSGEAIAGDGMLREA